MMVLDASALVDVVADRPVKDAVLAQMEGEHIIAPGHQLAEVSSAVIRLLRAYDLRAARARRALADAASLVQEVVPADHDQLRRAFELRDSIRVLDGLYVALAERHRCRLITTDGRLAHAKPPCDVTFVEVP